MRIAGAGWDAGGRPAPSPEAVARLFADRVLVASGPTSRSADSYGHRFAAPGRPVAAHRPGGRVRPGRPRCTNWPGSAGGAGEQHEVTAGHVCASRERSPPGSSDRHPAIRSCAGAREGGHSRGRRAGVPAPDAAGPASPAARRTRPACDRGQSRRRVPRPNRHDGAPAEPDCAGVRRTQSSPLGPPSPRRRRSRACGATAVGRLPLRARAAEGQDVVGTAERSCRRHRVKRRGWFIPRTATGCPSRS